MESIVRDGIVDHLLRNRLLSDDQHGFVPGRNCVTQLLLCLEEWTQMIENGESFDVIYTDFSKAFDSVAHERLMVKLDNIGVKGDLINWIRSFLSGRTQSVNVQGVASKWNIVISGIPQGFVIGPILFVIFINDMPDNVKYSMCKLFADDCKLYGTVNNREDNKTQFDLTNLETWSKTWQLPFNALKCKVMHFGNRNPKHLYYLNDHILEDTQSEKDLGVIIDVKLKYHIHTAAATKKANQILGMIKKSYTTRDAKTISTLYKIMVRPHLEYSNVIWGPFYQGDIRSVETIQRRATKLIPELKDFPYVDRMKNLELPSLMYRRRRGDMNQMYKIINGIVRIDKKLFSPAKVSCTRGYHGKIFKRHALKTARKNSISQWVINDWNSLPTDFIESPSIDICKNRLDKHWQHLHYVTID